VAAPELVGALDQGTTGTRFMVFDRRGAVVAAAYREHRQHYPQPGWVEHDPMEIWRNTKTVIRETLLQAGIRPRRLAAVGITNQRETVVLWERASGCPVAPAIVWQDTRTRALCQRLVRRGLEATVRRQTGLPVATYFSGPKLRWLLDADRTLRPRAARGELCAGTIDSWLLWWLSGGPRGGVHATDATNASRTMLMDLKRLEWDPQLLRALGVPRAILPTIRPSLLPEGYACTVAGGPLGPGVKIAAVLGDQQAALFGQACFRPGEAKNTYGTGNFLLLNTGARPLRSRHGLITTVACAFPDRRTYALEGSIAVTGAAIQWLRDNLSILRDATESESLAATVPDTGGVYFVPAFSGLFAPYWDARARGTITGLTRFATRAHLVRAALEAIAFQTVEVVRAMERDAHVRLRELRVDGGAVKNALLLQIQADLLGIPVARSAVNETTALGAATAAGLAAGLWPDLAALRRLARTDRTFRPHSTPAGRRAALGGWLRAVDRARDWLPA
jgi:glycerol kinase